MMFAFKVNSHLLASIAYSEQASEELAKTLHKLGFTESASIIMKANPKKFLWPDLLKFFEGKPQSMVEDCVRVLSKLDLLEDPGS
jgi:hypothetical protein